MSISQEEVFEAAVDSVHMTYRSEIAKLKMQLVVYRKALVEAGIEPPDMDGQDLLELVDRCNSVVSSATGVVELLGSGKELVLGW